VLDGEPFSVYTHVLETYIDGERVFDRSKQQDWTYQAGGFALATRSVCRRCRCRKCRFPS